MRCTRSAHALDGPFVAINCAAIPEATARERAVRTREGRLHRRASRKPGTALERRTSAARCSSTRSASCRSRSRPSCLRALEERRSEPRGRRPRSAAGGRAHRRRDQPRSREVAIGARQFREDLYSPDVDVSGGHATAARTEGRHRDPHAAFHRSVSQRTEQAAAPAAVTIPRRALQAYGWPGNVRELQNCIERAVLLADSDALHPRHFNLSEAATSPLAPAAASPWEEVDLSGTMADASRRVLIEVERRKIAQALRDSGATARRPRMRSGSA